VTTRHERRPEPHTTEPVHRRWPALLLTVGMLAVLTVALVDLPDAGAPLPEVARQALAQSLPAFRTTEVVSAVVYGFRATDTFGETFLLLAAVVSVIVLSRAREPRRGFIGEERAGQEEQQETAGHDDETVEERRARQADEEETGPRAHPEHEDPDRGPVGTPAPETAAQMSVVARSAVRLVLPLLLVAGVYLVLQGYSPGGGFPAGGVVLGVILLMYAAFGYQRIAPAVRPAVFEVVELLGAVLVVAVLVLGLPLTGSFAGSWVPLAPEQTLRSGGSVQSFSLSEFVEVGAGLTIVVFAVMGMGGGWTAREEQEASDREEGEPGREGEP
jgi:multicomponent Na+:H+ antiporter subunit B